MRNMPLLHTGRMKKNRILAILNLVLPIFV
jgi:hypothetical protein